MKSKLILLAFLSFAVSSCVKKIDEYQTPTTNNNPVTDIMQLNVPAYFNYASDHDVQFNIKIDGNTDLPLANVPVRIMTNSPENGGSVLFSGITDLSGSFSAVLKISKLTTSVVINTDYIGVTNNVIADVSSNYVSIKLGGSVPQRITTVNSKQYSATPGNYSNRSSSVPNKTYLGSWNGLGVPNYLDGSRDYISNDFLSRINSSLPERRPVPANNPNYLNSSTPSDIVMNAKADLYMTFVHEGAGYRNSIAYYVYNKNNPPKSTSDINEIKVIFPNLSYSGSGGGLVSGDKVFLGSFGQDTVVGFVVLADAYCNNTTTICNGNNQYYSDDYLNPESTSTKRVHNAVLWDVPTQKLVIGFEDLYRDGNSDDDFNDAIFYITANPSSAVSNLNMPTTSGPVDTDGDGVTDQYDEFPNDASVAFQSYYPSANSFGTIGFEDLWPYRGDFDFNDLVVGYRMNPIRNANNLVTSIKMKIFAKAVGGSYQNGFGIQLPISPSFVQSVTGTDIQGNYINLSSNGTESGQSQTVIIPFDNALNLINRPAGFYVNTEANSPISASDTLNITVNFTTPISLSILGTPPYNPFMISNLRRGYEIHLVDKAPTDLVDQSLLNTGNDKTNSAMGRYYKSDKNLPWAINIPGRLETIKEKTQITDSYLKFQSWAESGGLNYPDWYEDKPGYRNTTNLIIR